MNYEAEVDVALQAIGEAAVLCEQVRGELDASYAIEKSDSSPVTVADFGSQALICRRLVETFPDDAIVAEEDAIDLVQPEHRGLMGAIESHLERCGYDAKEPEIRAWIDPGNGTVGDRFWTIDPIDGTKGFLRNDQYAIALALIVEGRVDVAALACPVLDEGKSSTFLAVRGEGPGPCRRPDDEIRSR